MAGFTIGNRARARRADGETFLVFTYIWQEDVAKISKVPGAPRNVNPVREYCTIFQQFTPTSPVFTQKLVLNKLAREMLIEQIILFELRRPGRPGHRYTPITG